MQRDELNISEVPNDLNGIRDYISALRGDFDAHNHDGANSRSFLTLSAETVSARAIQVRKTGYGDDTAGIWMGLVGSDPRLYIGTASSYLKFAAGVLSLAGSFTATSGTIGGFTIGATSLSAVSGGNTTILSSGATAFSAGPTGSPSITISQAGVLTAVGGSITGGTIQTASSGARVRLNGSTSAIEILDSSGVVRMASDNETIVFKNASGTLIGSVYASSSDFFLTSANGILMQGGDDVIIKSGNGDSVALYNNTTLVLLVDGGDVLVTGDIIGDEDVVPTSAFNGDVGKSSLRWATVYCALLDEVSDERIKDNIESIPYGVSEVMQLKPIRFTFKDGFKPKEDPDGKQLGFSAQQVAKVIPEAVTIREELGASSIRKGDLTAVLVKAVQELHIRLAVLEKK